jgi:hypothetical protein
MAPWSRPLCAPCGSSRICARGPPLGWRCGASPCRPVRLQSGTGTPAPETDVKEICLGPRSDAHTDTNRRRFTRSAVLVMPVPSCCSGDGCTDRGALRRTVGGDRRSTTDAVPGGVHVDPVGDELLCRGLTTADESTGALPVSGAYPPGRRPASLAQCRSHRSRLGRESRRRRTCSGSRRKTLLARRTTEAESVGR